MVVNIDKDSTCSFTGHRTIPSGMSDYLFRRIKDGVNYLYLQGVRTFLAGGALGFDALAAEAVIECRKEHRDIRLVIVIPCRDQAARWSAEQRARYERINAAADEVICLAEHYYRGCMHDRNRYMIDNSRACICYLTEQTGGTAYTVGYARSKGLKIFNLAKPRKQA